MSNILNSEDFGLKIYSRFPTKYKEDDVNQNFALKRYLQALSDGGFKYSIDEINGIMNLIDPDKVDAKLLPILFKQYGLEVFNGIPEQYLRYLLPKLGEAWSKKGSLSIIEFITVSLSGIKTVTEITYDYEGNPSVDVKLEMDYNIGAYVPDIKQFTRVLQNFLPFYCGLKFIYLYLFYEKQVLNTKDNNLLDNVTYTNLEKSSAHAIDSDLGCTFTYVINETGYIPTELSKEKDFGMLNTSNRLLNSTLILNNYSVSEKIFNDITYKPTIEDITLSVNDILVENDSSTLKFLDEDSINVLRKGEPISGMVSVLGQAVLGQCLLGNNEENSDTVKNSIVSVTPEIGKMTYPVDTYIDHTSSVLNLSTDGIYSYDIITRGNVSSIFIH